jgi:signal peptidase I
MVKTKPSAKRPPSAADKKADGGWRETVESIAMAVILALLFRGFVAEAFVIPTGSMAPTLQGRHKDVKCPKCGYWYQTSASEERDEDRPTGRHIVATTCPICRYPQELDLFSKPDDHSFSGDRIIVGKFCYDLGQPERWDVIVFKFPGRATQNYIKRLVGLPGEIVRISGGNIYTRGLSDADDQSRIARKPPHKVLPLLQVVDDSEYQAADLVKIGWPVRWQEWPASDKPSWKTEDHGKSFTTDGTFDGDAWLRYRHLVPTADDWALIASSGNLPPGVHTRPGQLITDFYAYNAGTSIGQRPGTNPAGYLTEAVNDERVYDPAQNEGPGQGPLASQLGQHWVDDLAVECLANVTSNQGQLLLEIVRAGIHHQCRIDVATGKAALSMTGLDGKKVSFEGDDGQGAESPSAQTTVKGPGKYRLMLSNCDHEMLLWVNGSAVKFDGPTTYASDELVDPQWSEEDPGDLAPAGVGSHGSAVTFSRLRVLRDKYYIATLGGDSNDYDGFISVPGADDSDEFRVIQRVFADPDTWKTSNLFAPDTRRFVEFALEEDQFLPLGDNSPQSYDGRFWYDDRNGIPHHYVERDLLIGKALLIYWPHTWNRPIPFTPNFSKMQRIK